MNALDRKTISISVNGAEYMELEAGAKAAGISVPQFVCTKCGFEVRNTSNPATEERDREEDDAWERLRRLGLDPEGFFGNAKSADLEQT